MASGLPIAAFPVTGPIDIVRPGVTGVLAEDLSEAARQALTLDRDRVRQQALEFGWEACARLFLQNIEAAVLAKQGRRLPAQRSRITAARPAN